MKKSIFYLLSAMAVLLLIIGCKINVEPPPNCDKKFTGSISGRAFYSNAKDNSTIQITLDKTDGLRTASVLESCGVNDKSCYSIDCNTTNARNVVSYTSCNEDGSYSFTNLEPGVYTVYALAKDSSERAVSRNLTVVEDGEVIVPNLQLTATGSLSGKITVEENKSNNSGFVVFIAGTSYMAITDLDGSFEISNIPAGNDYSIVIMYGTYTFYWKNEVEVKPFTTSTVGEKVFTKDEYQSITNKQKGEDGDKGDKGDKGDSGKDGTSIIWKGAFASSEELKNPQYLWAYNNTTDGCSYIYDGEKWVLLASKGDKGNQGEPGKDAVQYEIKTTDIPAGDSKYPAGAIKIEILKDGVVVETKYIEKTGQTYINYELNGGYFRRSPTVSMLYGNTIDLEIPEKEGFIFAGWYLNNNFTGEKISKIECNETNSNIIVYAKWIEGKLVHSIDDLSVYLSNLSSSNEPYTVLLQSDSIDFEKLKNCLVNIKNGVKISFILPDGITTIPEKAFFACKGLDSVTIPDGVFYLGKNAFYGCSGLTSVTIPSSVTTIGEYAFDGCSGLTSITIPSSVTTIGKYAFYGCSSFTSVTIPSSVTSIGQSAFCSCNGLTSVNITDLESWCKINFADSYSNPLIYAQHLYLNDEEISSLVIPDTIISIGESAFYGCRGLTSVIIPFGVTTIGESAFFGCSGLTSVTIPSSVTSIGQFAFCDCNGLTSVNITDLESWCKMNFAGSFSNPLNYAHHLYLNDEEILSLVIPDTITSIGKYAFYDCKGLTSITIPSSVTAIGQAAFYGCSGLTSVIIPSNVTSIGSYVFYDCNGLTSVTIPSSVTSIGSSVFSGCSGLTSVTIPSSVTSIGDRAFLGCWGLTSVNITDIEAWCKINFADSHSNPLYYAHYLYLNGEEISSLVIPDTIISIGKYAFYGCSSFTSVTIPSSVTSIGESAFYDCWGLTSVNITDIEAWCKINFADRYSNPLLYAQHLYLNDEEISSLVIPDTIISIGKYAFYGCSSFTFVTIPSSVTSIGESAFYGCRGLTSITIPSSVTAIGQAAFYGCNNVTKVTVPKVILTNFKNYGFYSDNLKTVIIADGVTYIDAQTFYGCSGLTSVKIPSSVTTIGGSAFYNCSGLTSVTIPSSVTSIGDSAFHGCSGLTSITIPSSVTSIGEIAFFGCSGLTSVTIPSNVTSIGWLAFCGCSNLTSLTFEDATTWYKTDSRNYWNNKTGGTRTDVSDPATNATNFSSKTGYDNYYWYKL